MGKFTISIAMFVYQRVLVSMPFRLSEPLNSEWRCFTQVAIARNVDCGGSGGEAGGTLEVHLPWLDFR